MTTPKQEQIPCPGQITLDYLSDEEIDDCEVEIPDGFVECDYEYDYLDIDAVRVTIYCGDPPPEEPEENEQEDESEDGSEPENDQTEDDQAEETIEGA